MSATTINNQPNTKATIATAAGSIESASTTLGVFTNCDKSDEQKTPARQAQLKNLTRVPFTVSRLMEYCNRRELVNQTGHHVWECSQVIHDIATKTGWAAGSPGEVPTSGSMRFGKPPWRTASSSAEAVQETPRTLDELVTWGSLTAEKVFKGKGDLPPVYFIWSPESPDGTGVVPAPIPVMKAMFEHYGVDRYVFIGEAWTGPEGTRPSEHPDRREIVLVVAEDRTGMKAGWRNIVRPASGKPKLAPIEMGDDGMVGGRMANLLQAKTARH